MKRMLFVYNPRSGTGQIRNQLSAIVETFSLAGYDVTVHPTSAGMDCANVVRERASQFDMVVCCGGDGTLDEAVSGLLDNGADCPLGYIPAGSTNDFGNSLGIPKQMDKAAAMIVNGLPFSCDIGQLNNDYFVYVAAFGFMTDVSYQTNQELKNVLGHTAYILEGIKRVGAWKTYHLNIESDEFTDEGDFIYGMISNSTSVGGIKGLPGKDVDLDDGLFEVMLVRSPQDLADWSDVISAIVLQNNNSKNVIRFKTRRLTVSSDEPVAWTRDGEDGGAHRCAQITNLPRSIRFMVADEQTAETAKAF